MIREFHRYESVTADADASVTFSQSVSSLYAKHALFRFPLNQGQLSSISFHCIFDNIIILADCAGGRFSFSLGTP